MYCVLSIRYEVKGTIVGFGKVATENTRGKHENMNM